MMLLQLAVRYQPLEGGAGGGSRVRRYASIQGRIEVISGRAGRRHVLRVGAAQLGRVEYQPFWAGFHAGEILAYRPAGGNADRLVFVTGLVIAVRAVPGLRCRQAAVSRDDDVRRIAGYQPKRMILAHLGQRIIYLEDRAGGQDRRGRRRRLDSRFDAGRFPRPVILIEAGEADLLAVVRLRAAVD